MDERSPNVSSLSEGTSALLATAGGADRRDAVLDALGTADPETGVLLVATEDAEGLVTGLRRRGVAPEAIGVVDASEESSVPSGVAESDTVSGPGSLSAIGIATSDLVERLSHRYDRVVVGVESTTPILTATTLPATFRFLHVLGGRVKASDGVLLVGFDPSAHEEESQRTISQLFDETVAV